MWLSIAAFLPIFIAIVFVFDLLTAFLLYSHYRVSRLPSLAVLSATYLYSGLITIPHILTFPTVFSANGLLHAGSQTAVWLWVFWHGGFPVGIIFFSLVERFVDPRPLSEPMQRLFPFALFVTVPIVIVLLTLLTTRFHTWLPVIVQKGNYTLLWTSGAGPVVLVFCLTAFLLVFSRTRGRTLLQLWVSVSVFALLLDVSLTLLAGARYSIGWYVARLTSVLSAGVVLASLVHEVTSLYAKVMQQDESIKHHALHDALTGLPNRSHFAKRLEQALEQAHVQKRQLAVMFIDLDGFKQVNDTFGHDMGDLLLIEVAKRLKNGSRAGDTVGRLGGDEFTVILPFIHSPQDAELVATRILHALREPFVINGHPLAISSSIGICCFPDHGIDSVELMKHADIAMYEAKHGGKNRFVFYND